ncbi:flagellar basal body L-ring protein FlgH [Marinivivus vitaminiproducens]|uniref:flagellar basal body L-ring protein FlgH n=1 Tax=Marinivivus vitaminiproducens TaxID=3035935 RepID=UPI0027A0CC57|nr:flagellar basal body L-ring protein FlgH [Geminicoccaceae bacterium SCSIO 64248]
MTRAAAILLTTSGLLLAGGCARFDHIGREPSMSPPGQPQAAVLPPDRAFLPYAQPAPAAIAGAGSLWQPVSLFSDQRARAVGDVLTVLIRIDDQAQIDNTTERSRASSEEANVTSLFGIDKEIDKVLPGDLSLEPGVDIGADSSTRGDGSVRRNERIELKVAALVKEVLPNGNLAILGSQEIRVNYELRDLQIAGVIRPQDISRDNTISYEKIAEARIVYGGRGQIYDVQQPRYGQQVLDVIMPF